MNFKKLFALSFTLVIAVLTIYYFYPIQKIPNGITIDKIIVFKSNHKLLAYSNGRLIVAYKIAIGKNSTGDKEYERDMKTPEGSYIINDKNPTSRFHKNLGISYPNPNDIGQAKQLLKSIGGDIKIHGLKTGQDFLGRYIVGGTGQMVASL